MGMATPRIPPYVVCAHRGGAGPWPENSLAAFRHCAALGVDAVELDIHMTADGRLAVIHDATLDRLTDGRGAVAETTAAALARLGLRGPVGTDEPVPMLEDALAILLGAGIAPWIEIKNGADGAAYPGIEDRLADLLADMDAVARCAVLAFDWDLLERLRARAPGLRLAGNLNRQGLRARGGIAPCLARLTEIGADTLSLDRRLADAPLVARIAGAGLAVALWTVNAESDMRGWRDQPVSLLITDRPETALRVRAEAAPD